MALDFGAVPQQNAPVAGRGPGPGANGAQPGPGAELLGRLGADTPAARETLMKALGIPAGTDLNTQQGMQTLQTKLGERLQQLGIPMPKDAQGNPDLNALRSNLAEAIVGQDRGAGADTTRAASLTELLGMANARQTAGSWKPPAEQGNPEATGARQQRLTGIEPRDNGRMAGVGTRPQHRLR
ncbi:MAG: hypothetical protein ACAI38_15910 [Myxococcota bacterium]